MGPLPYHTPILQPKSTIGPPGAGLSIAAALAAFIVSRKAEGKTAKTLSFYEDNIGRYVAFLAAEQDTAAAAWADPIPIERFLLHERQRNLSDSSIHARYRALRALFNWLVSRGIMAQSPMAVIREPQRETKAPRRISRERFEALLASVPVEGGTWIDHRDRLIMQLLFWAGLRAGETAGLHIDDISLSERLILIRKTKGRRARYVPLPRALDEPLARYLFSRPQFDTARLFISSRAFNNLEPALSAQGLGIMIRRRCRAAALPGYGPHAFRHAFAMEMLNRGRIDMGILSRLLGHSSTTTTQKCYADWETDSLQHAYEMAEQALNMAQ